MVIRQRFERASLQYVAPYVSRNRLKARQACSRVSSIQTSCSFSLLAGCNRFGNLFGTWAVLWRLPARQRPTSSPQEGIR